MNSLDAFWLSFLGTFATIGFIIVIIGVVIEGVEHFKKFPRKEHARKLRIEKLGWFLVIVGLAMELLGDHAAKRISDREAARLNMMASNARSDAAKSFKQAGEAKERAAHFESDSKQFALKIEELRSNNNSAEVALLKLRKSAAARARIFTPYNEQTFIKLLNGKSKGPVRVAFIRGDYHLIIVDMDKIADALNEAGYPVPSGVENLSPNSGLLDNLSGSGYSVVLFVHDTKNAPPYTQDIAEAFNAIGMPADVMSNPTAYYDKFIVETNQVVVFVVNPML
jgi:hypothetical protein